MKEVVEWNGIPRIMKVFDTVDNIQEAKVIYIIPSKESSNYPVIVINDETDTIFRFKHCAELEKRVMTCRELAVWLRQNPEREWKFKDSTEVRSLYIYDEPCANELVADPITIREGIYDTWREPLIDC